MRAIPLLSFVVFWFFNGPANGSNTDQSLLEDFLSAHCYQCHGRTTQKADRRLDQFDFKNLGINDAEVLQEVLDQLNLASMPPQDSPQPSDIEIKEVVNYLTTLLSKLREEARRTTGKVVLRRLNRSEYRNTIRDLFELEMSDFDPTVTFPADNVTDGFDNVGEGLVISDYLLQNYLDAARAVADKVIQPGARPEKIHYGFGAGVSDDAKSNDSNSDKQSRIESGRLFTKFRQPIQLPELSKRGAPADGEYAIRFSAQGVRRQSRYKDEDLRYDSSQPMRLAISIQSRELGPTSQRIVGEYEIPDDQPVEIEHRVWLQKGFIFSIHWANGPEGSFKRIMRKVLPIYQPDAVMLARNPPEMYIGSGPELHINSLEFEGPFYEHWPPKGFAKYFPNPPNNPGLNYLDASLVRVASQAFRRPVAKQDIESYLILARTHFKEHGRFWDAAKYGLQALLTSPHFLYLVERPKVENTNPQKVDSLTQHELATRLSYFLWSSLPDAELRLAADQGELGKQDVLRQQVQRMMMDDKVSALVENFTGQWLHLRKLGTMPPDPEKYKAYYEYNLEEAMRRETTAFFSYILQDNRSILEFIDSDYTFLNSALANHYGIPMPENSGFQKVLIPKSSMRGGLLGQASILTATSNGVESLPVTRGVWVLENLLGQSPSPPPPDIEPIEPDTRGSTTIREMMEKHRKLPTCYECHRHIDPFGLALENYDHLGVWRDSYHQNLSIDSRVQLSQGIHLNGVAGIKQHILSNADQFSRCITEKLMIYALGRRLNFTDRDDINQIVSQMPKHNYSFQQLIQFIVSSKPFNSK